MSRTRTPVQSQVVIPLDPAAAWQEIRSAWRERNHDMLHQVVERLGGVRIETIDDLFDGNPAPDVQAAAEALQGVFRRAATTENHVLIALYVYAACLDKWERGTDYDRIRRAVQALEITTAGLAADGGPANELLEIVVAQARSISVAMAVESGINCACPIKTGSRARDVAQQMTGILQRLPSMKDKLVNFAHVDAEILLDVIRQDAETNRRYFGAVAKVAAAVEEMGGQSPTYHSASDVIDEVHLAEAALHGDVYETELRAHRITLSALLEQEGRPRLGIKRAELVYVYPFGLDPFDWAAFRGHINRRIHLDIFGATPIDVHALRVHDLWQQPTTPEPAWSYGGASISLPPVRVTTTATTKEEHELVFDAEVRLSRLGNHYLRVSMTLQDANLHLVNQALRRGSRSMGEEEIRSSEGSWHRITEYASDLIASLAKALSAEPVGDPNATFHVALAAREITVQDPNGDPRPAVLEDLEQAVGTTLLFHPLRGLATTLEEWVRYPPAMIDDNLLEASGYTGELVIRTANTTVLYMPSSPEWRTAGYQEMIEFVASVPTLLMLWQQQAVTHAESLEHTLGKLKSGVGEGDLEGLYLREAELREREGEIRQKLALFHSPWLCHDRSERDFIDRLWEAAGLRAVEDDLKRGLGHLSALQERVSTIAAATAERHRQRDKDRAEEIESQVRKRAERMDWSFQLVGIFLAVASVAELFSLLNSGFALGHWGWTTGELIVLAAVALGVYRLILGVGSILTLDKLRARASRSPWYLPFRRLHEQLDGAN